MAYRERRSVQRFKLGLPVTVRWINGSAVGEARTESRDVCSQGIYFFLPNEIKSGSPVEIIITLPRKINVRCLGRVQRSVRQAQGGAGVAVHIERHATRTPPKASVKPTF